MKGDGGVGSEFEFALCSLGCRDPIILLMMSAASAAAAVGSRIMAQLRLTARLVIEQYISKIVGRKLVKNGRKKSSVVRDNK